MANARLRDNMSTIERLRIHFTRSVLSANAWLYYFIPPNPKRATINNRSKACWRGTTNRGWTHKLRQTCNIYQSGVCGFAEASMIIRPRGLFAKKCHWNVILLTSQAKRTRPNYSKASLEWGSNSRSDPWRSLCDLPLNGHYQIEPYNFPNYLQRMINLCTNKLFTWSIFNSMLFCRWGSIHTNWENIHQTANNS